MSIIMRVIGLSMIAFALVIFGIDLFAMYAKGGAFTAHSIGEDWQLYSRTTYVGFNVWLEHALPAKLASYVEVALGLWTWAVLALAGVLITPLRHHSWNISSARANLDNAEHWIESAAP